MRIFLFLALLLLIGACTTRTNKFSDPILVKIYELKDRRSTDSLLQYLNSENPVYRQEAALAFASLQDSLASSALGNILLEDQSYQARLNAAYALGQTGGYQAVNALIPALNDTNRWVVREVLEGLGKTSEPKDLDVLRNFQTNDTLLQEGLSWAYYRLALRNKADSSITKRAANYLKPSFSFQTRLGAASYFGRSTRLQGNYFKDGLLAAAQKDLSPEVRMMAVSGFRNLPLTIILPTLKEILRSEKDYRVRISAIRVCNNFPLTETQEVVFGGLRDSIEMVQVTASEVIRNLSDRYPSKRIGEEVKEANSWRVKSNLFAAQLISSPSDKVIDEIKTIYAGAPVYFRSALLSALGQAQAPLNKNAFDFLANELLQPTQGKVLLSSSAAALTTLDSKSKGSLTKSEFLRIYKDAIAHGDPAVIGIVASALTDTSLHYKKEITDLQFLYTAKESLVLPKDIESLEPLERAIAYLEGKERPKPLKNEFNHPIPWKMVKTIPSGQRVELTTTRGVVILRLFVEESPGSVVNFVELLNAKYFDEKFFHRVVPNFVIQTGCNRGDGFGSEDYSIRSEFSSRRYNTGSVGMASAGKDTEGTQWFITHSPTPHLDGRYTLFAEVVSGIESVHKMEVGDKILSAKLVD